MIPSLFILGAPKCGTSALYEYLAGHPGLFLPDNKEPHYHASDFYVRDTGLSRRMADRERYLSLFAEARPDQIAGEGSTWYLASEAAVPSILADASDARFIVMLRAPWVMARSLHAHHVRKLYDDVEDFETAWSLSKTRAAGDRLPKHCPDPKMLDYPAACTFAPKLERLFAQVPRDRALVLIYEEVFADPRAGYLRVLDFLGLPDDGRTDFARVNPNRELRSKWLYALTTYRPWPLRAVWPLAKRIANGLGLRPGQALFEANQKITTRTPTKPETDTMLRDAFAADVTATEAILGRRIEMWAP